MLTCSCLTGLFVVQLHSWQPGIKNPYRGMVVWPVPENIDISVTLFKVAAARIHFPNDDKAWFLFYKPISKKVSQEKNHNKQLGMQIRV